MRPDIESSQPDPPNQGHNIGDNQCQTPIQLDGRINWTPVLLQTARHWYIPVFVIGYGVHRVFRRYVPRRTTPWTSLRLSESYAAWGLGMWLLTDALPSLRRVHKDDDLAVVAVAGPLAASESLRRSVFCTEAIHDPRSNEIARAIRESSSKTGGLLEKLRAWHYHIYSERAAWDSVAATIVYRSLQADPSWTPQYLTDFDLCTSFIARYMHNARRAGKIEFLLAAAFAASVPATIVLRSSGRRSLYLPGNIFQRVLIGVILYSEAAFAHHSWNTLWSIRDRPQVAAAVRRVFGSTRIDEEIADIREALKLFDIFDQ